MGRTEAAFRALHERVLFLEQQHARVGPSDEQVERVLRKILAERFGDGGQQPVENQGQMKDVEYFVKPPDNTSIPRAPLIDPIALAVDPEAVPSKAYAQTFQMLEKGLSQYPQTDVTETALSDTTATDTNRFKRPDLPPSHSRQW